MSVTHPAPFDLLLEYLKRTRGFDFSGYKRATLERRVAKRMEELGISNHLEYLDHLEVNPDEFGFLFNTILINVTGFYRDGPSWEYVASDILPRLLDNIGVDAPIRVWCAGCSTGEETYTLAMVLADSLGEDAYAERVKIYATDVDDEALTQARLALFTAKQVESVPQEKLDRYFDRIDHRFAFRKELRRTVIFGRNDLVQDAPISRIDLLACRNTLMYFNTETQTRILKRFHFALSDWGYLFLGKSEMLITHAELFKPIDLRRRVFTKVAKPTFSDRLLVVAHPELADTVDAGQSASRDIAFDTGPVAQIVVSGDGTLVLANRSARALFQLGRGDVGRPLKDLELSYRPVDLRSNLDLAAGERRTVVLEGVAHSVSGLGHVLDVHVTPLLHGDEAYGASVTFHDVTGQQHLQEELEKSKRELELAYEELQSTVEELETTNEELQSTNEELETTNEELQSTNEELETMNEELQSTNAELETINDELRRRGVELNEVNAFLETILTSLAAAVVVVDRMQAVQVWNQHATNLWGLRADEAEGQNILALDIGLPVAELKAALRSVLQGTQSRSELVLDATNRRGRAIRCRVTCLPMTVSQDEVTGAILLMEPLQADGDS